MTDNKQSELYTFLEANNISFERTDHKAVYTVKEASEHILTLPGAKLKNLFLCDKKGDSQFLVVAGANTNINLSALATLLGVKKLRFGSPARLMKMLSITPGSVSPLALLNDPNHLVTLVVDNEVIEHEAVQCHPLVNTSTLVIPTKDLLHFCEATGHNPNIISIP